MSINTETRETKRWHTRGGGHKTTSPQGKLVHFPTFYQPKHKPHQQT
jgi:hypothetical protein